MVVVSTKFDSLEIAAESVVGGIIIVEVSFSGSLTLVNSGVVVWLPVTLSLPVVAEDSCLMSVEVISVDVVRNEVVVVEERSLISVTFSAWSFLLSVVVMVFVVNVGELSVIDSSVKLRVLLIVVVNVELAGTNVEVSDAAEMQRKFKKINECLKRKPHKNGSFFIVYYSNNVQLTLNLLNF